MMQYDPSRGWHEVSLIKESRGIDYLFQALNALHLARGMEHEHGEDDVEIDIITAISAVKRIIERKKQLM